MTELFRSAFNYLSQTVPVNVIGKLDHPLVGTNIEVDGLRLKIRSLIAEGLLLGVEFQTFVVEEDQSLYLFRDNSSIIISARFDVVHLRF